MQDVVAGHFVSGSSDWSQRSCAEADEQGDNLFHAVLLWQALRQYPRNCECDVSLFIITSPHVFKKRPQVFGDLSIGSSVGGNVLPIIAQRLFGKGARFVVVSA